VSFFHNDITPSGLSSFVNDMAMLQLKASCQKHCFLWAKEVCPNAIHSKMHMYPVYSVE